MDIVFVDVYRLEGSVTERNKLGSSISKKETTINELQTKWEIRFLDFEAS